MQRISILLQKYLGYLLHSRNFHRTQECLLPQPSCSSSGPRRSPPRPQYSISDLDESIGSFNNFKISKRFFKLGSLQSQPREVSMQLIKAVVDGRSGMQLVRDPRMLCELRSVFNGPYRHVLNLETESISRAPLHIADRDIKKERKSIKEVLPGPKRIWLWQ